LIIDNGSDDAGTLDILHTLAAMPATTVICHDAPFNYAQLNNIAARQATGEILLFLNDDTEMVSPDGLEVMAGYAQLSHVGAVGAKLLYPGTLKIQHVGVINIV